MEAYVPNENISDSQHTPLTEDIADALKKSLSKTHIAILKELYHHPYLQQKALAANIHTTVSSLSNMLGKIDLITPPLLTTKSVGRSKYYALTEIASTFVAQEILPSEMSNIHTFSSAGKDSLLTDTLETLYCFQNLAGKEWFLTMDDILCGNEAENSDELMEVYKSFMNHMAMLRIQQKDSALHNIYDVLSHSILIRRIERYLDNALEDYYALEPLFDLEKQDVGKAFALIDDIFAELRPSAFPRDKACENSYADSISQEQYSIIFRRLSGMIYEFCTEYHNKAAAIAHWKSVYFCTNASLLYIAEKCNSIVYTK